MAEQKMLRITLVKSVIGGKPVHKKNAAALGLRKLNGSVLRKDTPTVRGMIQKIIHLVEVDEVDGDAS